MNTTVQRATTELFNRVTIRSPVDTGRFRANWNVSYGQADDSTTTSTDKARATTEAAKALTLPVGGIVWITNGLPYAYRLEYGYSKQAPVGMIRLAVRELSDAVQKALP